MKLTLKFKPRNRPLSTRIKRQEPDWLGWGLDYSFGFVVGVFMSFAFLIGAFPPHFWIQEANILLFLIGGGLFAGALSSFYGDLFPLGDIIAPQHFPARAPSQSALSRLLSLTGGATGVACVVYWMAMHLY